jgi:hypothetical protein
MLRVTRLLLVIVPLMAASAVAQGPGTRFGGIIGGVTLSDMNDFPVVSDSRWGATAGLLVGMNTGPTAVTFEGTWIQKGGGDTRIDYLEFPLTLGAVGVLGDGAARGRLYSGLSIGFKISCSSDDVNCDNVEGTEFGWPLGIQLAKVTPTGSFFGIDARYTVALSDAFDGLAVHNRPWAFRLMFGKQLGTSSR